MEQEYSIKGIEKIIEIAGKERLAKYYGVEVDSDFEKIITEDFKKHNIPSGLEIALYFSVSPEEFNKALEERRGVPNAQDVASEIYKQDARQRAMFGFNYISGMHEYDEKGKMTDGTWGNTLYFFVDEPIKADEIGDFMYSPRYFVGGVQYRELLMGKSFFEEHQEELKQTIDTSKKKAVEEYISNFMDEFENVEFRGGDGPRSEYEETDKIREEKAKNEKIILEITGKKSIDELSLKDFLDLKRRLEQEEETLQKEFEEKFTERNREGRE